MHVARYNHYYSNTSGLEYTENNMKARAVSPSEYSKLSTIVLSLPHLEGATAAPYDLLLESSKSSIHD